MERTESSDDPFEGLESGVEIGVEEYNESVQAMVEEEPAVEQESVKDEEVVKDGNEEELIAAEDSVEVDAEQHIILPNNLVKTTSSDKGGSATEGSVASSCPYDEIETNYKPAVKCCGKIHYGKLCCLIVWLLLVAAGAACVPLFLMPFVLSVWHPTDAPTKAPSRAPSSLPTTGAPFSTPTIGAPSLVPSESPSTKPTRTPTIVPSRSPSVMPSTLASTGPSPNPTLEPSSMPSFGPTLEPSSYMDLSATPTSSPTFDNSTTIFYAIGDVPYTNQDQIELEERMLQLPDDADFLIHLGDIRSAEDPTIRCRLRDYLTVSNILLQSPIPVFVIPGDNEWNDCPNPLQGQSYWLDTFSEFYRNWNHPFVVDHHPQWKENFVFAYKGTLYFGLNLVSGAVGNETLYSTQLGLQFLWVKSKMDAQLPDLRRVVLFGHAVPLAKHEPFFGPLSTYMADTLQNQVPVLYLNGDNHYYEFEPNYRGISSFQRLQVDFGTTNPPLKVIVSPWREGLLVNQTFSHDRMLG